MSHRSQSSRKGRGAGTLSRLLASLLSVCLVLGTAPLAYAEGLSDDGAETAAGETVTEEMEPDLPVVEEESADEVSEPIASETTGGEVDDDTEPVVDAAETEQEAPAAEEGSTEGELLATAEAQDDEGQGDSETPIMRQAPAVPAPDGFTAGPNGLLAYRIDSEQRVDVRGLFDGEWIGSTYSNRGYRPIVRIDEGSSGVEGASAILGQTGLVVTALPSFSEDGRAIFLRYSIEHPEGSAPDAIGFDFAIAGDIRIGRDDSANVVLMDSGRGFYMTSAHDFDDNGTPASLAIYFSNTSGVDEPTAVWIGRYGQWWDNFFSDQREGTDNVDSAFSVSWQGLSLEQGETLTRGIASAVGELAEQALPEPEPDPEPEPEPEPVPVPVPEPEPEKTPQQASSRTGLPTTGDGIRSAALPAMLGLAVLLMGVTLAIRRREIGC